MAKTDAEILDGSPIDITFNGKTYTWRQLSRRKQRRARAALMEIAAIAGEAQGSGDMIKASAGMLVTSMVLEFCEDYHAGMSADMDEIDEYVENNPKDGFGSVMTDVYQPLFDAWLAPWLASTDDTDDDDDDDAKKNKSTKNRNSTKP